MCIRDRFKKATFNGKEILPNASVTLAESNTLIYNYERLRIPAKVTFEYVNESGQTVKPLGVATLIGKIGDTVKLSNAPMLLKHQLKEIRFNGTVKTVGDNVTLEPENTVIYVYMAKEEKPATVTVSYKDDQGNNVAPNTQVAVRGNVGAKVNVPQAPEVSGYHVVGITFNGQNVTANSQVTLSKQNELVYNYEAKLVDEHVLQLNIIDDTTQKVLENGIVLGKGLLNEPVAKDVVDKYNAKFEELRTKGYDVRSYDELPADYTCLLYTSPSPRDPKTSRMPSSA